MIKYEPKPVDTSPARDEDLSPEELVRQAYAMRGAERLKAESFTLSGEPVAREEIVVNMVPVKESAAAQFLRELKEEPMMKKKEQIETLRQRIRAVMIPEGFHTCGDPKCAATEILRLRREGERRRTALSRKSSKASPSGRS